MGWKTKDIPDQTGKRAVITGATGGLGYETALALSRAGAEVILTGRNQHKADAAMARIRDAVPSANIAYRSLDLGRIANVTEFGERLAADFDRLDLLVNNAGVMMPPERQTTADGFELQFGTNHLAHFALTAALLPLLSAANGRVVTVSSLAHRFGHLDFDDLQATKNYSPSRAYGQSKLANLVFAIELQSRSDTSGWGITSLAAHPGMSNTDLFANGPGTEGVVGTLGNAVAKLLGQSAAAGALPQLYAATNPIVKPGEYYGPNGLFELRGTPKAARISSSAKDPTTAMRLWQISEQLTDVHYPVVSLDA